MPSCSFIVPARNAADTIAETLQSVRAQSRPDWQLLVIDDGSTDDTHSIVHRLSQRDARIHLLAGPARGPGAARNVGLAAAQTAFITFLDADDLIDPQFLSRMTIPLEASADVVASYCGWQRLTPSGDLEPGPCPDVDGDLFDAFAAACVFPPLACMARRDALVRLGGFDEHPTTTEDWDLWQRLARTGARFVRVPGVLVSYRMRESSRSRDHHRVQRDGLGVIAVGHGADPRVPHAAPQHARGSDPARWPIRAYSHLCWSAGMAVAGGHDPLPLLDDLASFVAPDLDPWVVAGTLLESMRVARCLAKRDGPHLVLPQAPTLLAFLDALEHATQAPDLARRAAHALDTLLLEQAAPPRPAVLLRTIAVDVHVDSVIARARDGRIQDLETVVPEGGAAIDRIVADVYLDGHRLGVVARTCHPGVAATGLLLDAIADDLHWTLLQRYIEAVVYPTLRFTRRDDAVQISRHGLPIGPELPADTVSLPDALHHAIGWSVIMQELVGMPPLSMSDLYGEHVTAAAPPRHEAGGIITFDLADVLRDVHTNSPKVLVRCAVAGRVFAEWDASVSTGVLSAGTLLAKSVDAAPTALLAAVVRFGILGWPLTAEVTLRDRLMQAGGFSP